MSKPHQLTKSQKKVMAALAECGGCVDRFGRVIAAGETFTQAASNSVLHAVAAGLVSGSADSRRLFLTPVGRDVLKAAA